MWGGSVRTSVGERPRNRGTVWDDSGREVILQLPAPYVTPALRNNISASTVISRITYFLLVVFVH
jgi:hypothetical protein